MISKVENAGIGSRLREIREYLNETQTVFAERLGLSRDDIANYERERCDPPTRLLAGLDHLGFNISWILNGLGPMHNASASAEDQLPSDDRNTVSLEDLVYSQMLQTEALARLLVRKCIISKEEFLEEVKAVNMEQHEKAGKVGIG